MDNSSLLSTEYLESLPQFYKEKHSFYYDFLIENKFSTFVVVMHSKNKAALYIKQKGHNDDNWRDRIFLGTVTTINELKLRFNDLTQQEIYGSFSELSKSSILNSIKKKLENMYIQYWDYKIPNKEEETWNYSQAIKHAYMDIDLLLRHKGVS